jgi:uncharacterized protein (DUF433 family)
MKTDAKELIGVGLYSISETARLTQIPYARIRRWVRGYQFKAGGGYRKSLPVVESQLKPIDHTAALTFLDLLEIRVVDEFLDRGVSWTTLRRAHSNAAQAFHTSHPFCTRRFKTDGREIFAEINAQAADPVLVALSESQRVFGAILEPYLEDVDFQKDQPLRWWPLGRTRGVVIDPTRNFGKPIVAKAGVPTVILAQAYDQEHSYKTVAAWYEVDERAVREAVQFERRPAA